MIPTPFYELLPYVYVLIGALATMGIEATLGKICGMLLITSGIVIYKARSDYRNRQYQPEKAASRKSRGYSHRQLEISRRNTTEPAGQVRLPLQSESDFTIPAPIYAIPTFIYELLPLIYAVPGVLAVIGIEGIPGKLCGALLIIASMVIYQARWRYRYRKIRPADMATQSEVSMRDTEDSLYQTRMQLEEYFEKGAASEQSRNYQAALEWYRKAAEQGYASAQVNLGSLYAEGQGTPQDFQEALRWYHKAADQGYAPAQFNLGIMCIMDQGNFSKDYVMAYVWFSRAAMQGDEDARQAQEQVAIQLTAGEMAQAQRLLGRAKPLSAVGQVSLA